MKIKTPDFLKNKIVLYVVFILNYNKCFRIFK